MRKKYRFGTISFVGTIFIVLIVLSVLSCSKTDIGLQEESQEKKIDTYLENFIETEHKRRAEEEIEDREEGRDKKEYYPKSLELKIVEGSRVVLLEAIKGGGDIHLERGDSVYFYFAAYTFGSAPTSLFSTNIYSLVSENLKDADLLPKKMLYDSDNLLPGLYNGLNEVKAGDHLIVAFSSKYGFGNSAMATVPKMSPLYYRILIEKIVKNTK